MTWCKKVCLVGLVLAASLGCSDDPGAVQADVTYRIRCDDESSCQRTTYSVVAIDGEMGASVSCSVAAVADGNRLLTFRAAQSADDGIELIGALFSPQGSGTIIGGGCNFKASYDGNDFAGGCRSGEPTMEDPCQVTNLRIEGATISGAIRCDELGGELTAGQFIDIGSPSDETEPFVFSFHNCRGL